MPTDSSSDIPSFQFLWVLGFFSRLDSCTFSIHKRCSPNSSQSQPCSASWQLCLRNPPRSKLWRVAQMVSSSTTLPSWYVANTISCCELLDKPSSLECQGRRSHHVRLQTEEPHRDAVHARDPLFAPSWRIRLWLVSLSFVVVSSSSFDWVCQYVRARKQGAFPTSTVHCERHEPGVVLLSADWALSTGHGFRYQPWRRWQACQIPGERQEYSLDSSFPSVATARLSSSRSQDHRRWRHLDFPAPQYHREAGRHHHL